MQFLRWCCAVAGLLMLLFGVFMVDSIALFESGCNLYRGKRCWLSKSGHELLACLEFFAILCTLKSVWVDLLDLRLRIKLPMVFTIRVFKIESAWELLELFVQLS